MVTALPGYIASLCLSTVAAYRLAPRPWSVRLRRWPIATRVAALRPIPALFAAWACLDAIPGPPWLRAGAFVAWPGAAVCAAAWGLKDEGRGPEAPRPHAPPVVPLAERPARDPSRRGGSALQRAPHFPDSFRRSRPDAWSLPHAIAAVYILAGLAASACYLPCHRVYPLALLASRWLAVALTLALLIARPPRTWAARACALPAVGLAAGVVGGVWCLWLPSSLDAVRAQWGRLANAETWLTLGATAACVLMAWREAGRK